ncbi:MAG: HlyD family efflux transporter periplasmic adaptor subunit [Acidobacteriia bacterium]|nr:HlyD family efflux transporter periplasmic adaptor subunit [Terriglobia bacterium]
MNILEALNIALPELPAEAVRVERPPRVDPSIIVREQLQEGRPVVLLLIPEIHNYYVFEPQQWALLQLFDGQRSYEEIADLFAQQTGSPCTPDVIEGFATETRNEKYWYKSEQEKNIALWETLKEERRKRVKKKSKYGDLSEISFSAWDPDPFLTWLHDRIGHLVFSRWFVTLNLIMFAFMVYIFASHWSAIARDTMQMFNFSEKGFGSILEIWVLLATIGLIHETAHGFACKHTGGGAHRMGFLLIYLSPAFFCDTTEAWVYGSKWQRIATVTAGIWITMLICSVASFIWWGTAAGTPVHNFAYLLMLVSGLLPVAINLNPLIKLDGYYIFTEMLEIGDLKENSTAFLSAWVRRNIFRLPVDVPATTFRRKLLYVPYTILSSAYGYTLLFVVVNFAYNIAHSYSPDWAFVPAGLLAWLVFKSRILTFGRFMKLVYLDKKDRVREWLRPGSHRAALAVAALVLLFAPVWRETVDGRFILEPSRRAVVRARVPGTVVAVRVAEGDSVQAGAPLVILRNLPLQSEAERVSSEAAMAKARTVEAQLRYADYGSAEARSRELGVREKLLHDQVTELTISSPIAGVLQTPRMGDLMGSYVGAGREIAEVADTSSFSARVYLPEALVRNVRQGAPAVIRPAGYFRSIPGVVARIAPAASREAVKISEEEEYTGVESTRYYPVTITVSGGGGRLRDGMTGDAKIFVRRRSIAGLTLEAVHDFARRKLW